MAEGWTVQEAAEQFAQAGIPFNGLDRVIRALPGFRRIGETPSGEHGGRGHAIYDIAQLQRLHSALAPWLTVPPPGDT